MTHSTFAPQSAPHFAPKFTRRYPRRGARAEALSEGHPGLGAHTRAAEAVWPILRDLVEARVVLGMRRPVLTTLRALVSFLDETFVVFASNRSIMNRAEGISESGLRRHIKALVELGFVIRRDSSNGKRYRIEAEDRDDLVFGLDLSPLQAARERIAEAAERCRQENRMIRYLRKQLGQLIFHARTLGRPEAEIQPYQNALRQKLPSTTYAQLCETMSSGLLPYAESIAQQADESGDFGDIGRLDQDGGCAFTSKMTGTGIQNDCHKNITEERLLNLVEAKSGLEPEAASLSAPDPQEVSTRPKREHAQRQVALIAAARTAQARVLLDRSAPDHRPDHRDGASMPKAAAELSPEEAEARLETDPALLRKARALAPDALAFADESPKSWQEVETLAWRLASWSGISPTLLSAAIEAAGRRMTAMAVLTVTQNSGRIRNPGAYFRTLTLGRHFPRFARPLAHLH